MPICTSDVADVMPKSAMYDVLLYIGIDAGASRLTCKKISDNVYYKRYAKSDMMMMYYFAHGVDHNRRWLHAFAEYPLYADKFDEVVLPLCGIRRLDKPIYVFFMGRLKVKCIYCKKLSNLNFWRVTEHPENKRYKAYIDQTCIVRAMMNV